MPSELVFIKQEKFDRQKYDIYFCAESEQFYLYQTKDGQFVEVENMQYFDESMLKIYVEELKSSTDFLNYVPPTINF